MSIIIAIPSIYFTVREKPTHIAYEIISESNVLDLHQPVSDLEIKYRGENIYEQKKNLRIIRIRIRNDGETHIRQNDFDQDIPWGIEIKLGEIVETPKLADTNSEYIRKNLVISTLPSNIISFSKIMFERNKYFIVELQILHSVNNDPELFLLGKIIGIEEQEVINICKDDNEPSFWMSVFYGSKLVQIVRGAIFFGASIGISLLAYFTYYFIDEKINGYKAWKKLVKIEEYLQPILLNKNDNEKIFAILTLVGAGGDKNMLKDRSHEYSALFPHPIILPERSEAITQELSGLLEENPLPRDFFKDCLLFNFYMTLRQKYPHLRW